MTQAQRFMLFIDAPKKGHVSLFTLACRAQGWDHTNREIRLRVFSVAVSFPKGHFATILDALREITSGEPLQREITSAAQLDGREDVDRVKALCLFLAYDTKGAQEVDNNEGKARRSRHVIVSERMKCLALYPLENPMGMDGAQALVDELLKDMFNKGRKFEKITLDDISEEPRFYYKKGSSQPHEGPSELQRLLMRLDGLLHTNKKPNGPQGYRVKAGHSLHDMRKAAGLDCDCAKCSRERVLAGLSAKELAQLVPPLPDGTDKASETVEIMEQTDAEKPF